MDEGLVTTKQASEITNLPEGTLRYFRSTNQGPPCFVLGRRVMYRVDLLRQWISEREQATQRGSVGA